MLPQRERGQTGLGAFSEALQPGLQQAFQLYLQGKMQEYQRQRQLKLAEQNFPELFAQPQLTLQDYQKV